MLYTRFKTTFQAIVRPLAQLLQRLGVRPNHITIATLLLGALCCIYFVQTRNVFIFSVLILTVGLLDIVDGAVARLSGQTTRWGSYLDAMTDRYFEAIVVVTVAHVTGYWLLCMLVIFGGITVSYAKARAAMEVPVSNFEWPDWFERGERGLVFIGGLVVRELYPHTFLGQDIFYWALVVLVIGTQLTVLQRMLRARKYINARVSDDPPRSQ